MRGIRQVGRIGRIGRIAGIALAVGLLAGCATPAPTLQEQYKGWPLKPYPVAVSVAGSDGSGEHGAGRERL